MYYKVMYKNKVIDVIDRLVTLKYQERHNCMMACNENEAQAILSSDGNIIWYVESLPKPDVELGYDTVSIEVIDKYEYERLKVLNGDTPEAIIDMFVVSLANKKLGSLIESLTRLYSHYDIDEDTVVELCEQYGISEKDKSGILSAR